MKLQTTEVEPMAYIKMLDPTARLNFSEHTQKWYLDSSLCISNGVIQSGIAEHRTSPVMAVSGFLQRLKDVKEDEFIVGYYKNKRREYRWNGFAFAECTRDIVLSNQ